MKKIRLTFLKSEGCYVTSRHPYGGTDIRSEYLLRHLIGTTSFSEFDSERVQMLADAHGWELEVTEKKD